MLTFYETVIDRVPKSGINWAYLAPRAPRAHSVSKRLRLFDKSQLAGELKFKHSLAQNL